MVRRLRFSGPKTSIICTPMTSLKTSIKTITYLSDTGCLEIQGASLPCFTAMRAEIALMSGSAFAVTHHAFSSGAGRTSDGNGSHASTLKSPSYTKSVSWQHYRY
ncbi:hypothetical protein BGK49_03060 [Shigella sp. FC1544]|nr:putative integrase [Shigella dysenteriae 225-75]ODQ17549.1 hypothetical protein BGK49_03060 [Shigella sp. FC1544]ODQ20595.1 hypothetical protein BGK52_02745 [Shigella sp. FC1056]